MKKPVYFLWGSACLFSVLMISGCEDELISPDNNKNLSTTVTTQSVATANYYVSTTGSDSNTGTLDKPFKTIEYAYSKCTLGSELVYVRGGTYPLKDKAKYYGLKLSGKSGKSTSSKIKIWAYPGERVVIDCSSMTASDDGIVGLHLEASYLHLKGFDVINLPQLKGSTGYGYYNVGILIKGNYVTLEYCTSHNNGGTGIHIGGTSNGTYLYNCDSYNNYDPYTYLGGQSWPGGNADGFHITVSGVNAQQTLRGCRSWNNSDDGYDCYGTDGYVDVDSCWAYKNGYLANNTASIGDGSGIKLGATSGAYTVVKKKVTRCVSAYNRTEGFTQNNGKVVMYIYNNTAYKNGSYQFDFGNTFSGQALMQIKNNLAIGTKINYTPYAIHDHNTWDTSVTANDADFAGVDATLMTSTRQSNGSLPAISTFKLLTTSDLYAKGSSLGYGSNIGAF